MFDIGDLMGIPRTVQRGTQTVTVWAEPDFFQRITDAAFPQVICYDDLEFADSKFATTVAKDLGKGDISRADLNLAYCSFYGLIADALHVVAKDSKVSAKSGRRSVLFLDELNRSSLDVRQAALQLVLNKEIHSHKLPYVKGKPTLVISAINPSDGYQVDELDEALIDRFLETKLEADTSSWLSWARSSGINPAILDYLTEHPDKLHWAPANGIGATPRSWAKLSDILDTFSEIPPEIHYTLIRGKIGMELAAEFSQFLDTYDKVVKVEDIKASVEKSLKSTTDLGKIAKPIRKLLEGKESIQKSQLLEALITNDITKDTPSSEAYPLLATLYAVESEIAIAFLTSLSESDIHLYLAVGRFDRELNKSALFTSLLEAKDSE